MKICCITTIDATLSAFVTEAMKLFVEEGHEVTLVSTMTEDFIQTYKNTFRLIPIPMHRGISIKDILWMPLTFYRLFRKEKFDYIQYSTPNASFYASIGAWLAKCPIRVYGQWGILYVGADGFMRRILKIIESLTCRLSTHIRPASQKNLDFAVLEGLYTREKAAIIGDGGTIGVDLTQFDINKRNKFRNEVRKYYPILQRRTVFCSVGRLNRDKGCFELLEAFLRMASERDDVALLMIGSKETKSLPTHFQEKVKSCPRIVFTGHSDKVAQLLSASDVLVHPSYREGFSMVIQEGMAMALPVLTTNIPGPSEVIENDVTGLLVEPRNAEALYEGMKQIIADPERMRAMGQAGLERCKRLFRRERMLQLTYEDRMKIIHESNYITN